MRRYSPLRIFHICCLRFVTYFPMSGKLRAYFSKIGGVRITDVSHTYIGEGVIFDSLYPEEIIIGKHVHITMRCIILSHSLDTSKKGIHWKKSTVRIGNNCFIGANTIICSNVHIGNNVIIGAGSIVTKNIPDNEIWAGNPAKFIKKAQLIFIFIYS